MVDRAEIVRHKQSGECECQGEELGCCNDSRACKVVGRRGLRYILSSDDKDNSIPSRCFQDRHSKPSLKGVLLHPGRGISTFPCSSDGVALENIFNYPGVSAPCLLGKTKRKASRASRITYLVCSARTWTHIDNQWNYGVLCGKRRGWRVRIFPCIILGRSSGTFPSKTGHLQHFVF